MKAIFKIVSVVAICAGVLVGCGGPDVEFDPKASAYFNEKIGPMTRMPGKVYEVELIQEGSSHDACTAIARIDGKMVYQFGAGAGFEVGGTNRCQLEGVVIRWTKEDGYSVATGTQRNFPSQIANYIVAETPRIFMNYK